MGERRHCGGPTIGVALAVLPALVACRSPTQIDVVVTTNVSCSKVAGTSVTTGTLGEVEDIPATTTTTSCKDEYIGSLVLVPTGDDSALVGFKVVTGINGTTANQCTPDDAGSYGANCIVARRALRYIPHTPLQVDVLMSGQCAGKACDPQSTCVAGECVPATIGNSAQCEGTGCDEGVLVPDGGIPDATVSRDAATDAAGDGTVVKDATSDAPLDAPPDAPADAPPDASPSLTAVPGCDLRGALAGAAWPMEDYCPSHRNRSPLLGPPANVAPSPRWTKWFGGNGTMITAPAIGPDGTIYVAIGTGVVALDPDAGNVVWTYKAPDDDDAGRGTVNMPALASDGTVRVLDIASGNYAVLSLDGGMPVRPVTPLVLAGFPYFGSAITLAGDGTQYASDIDSFLVSFDSAGTVAWADHGVTTQVTYPTVAPDGTVLAVDTAVQAFYPDGGLRWSTDCGADPSLTTAAVAVDGTFRAFTWSGGVLFGLAVDGGLMWQVQVGGGDPPMIAVADDGTTYVGAGGALSAWTSKGQEAGVYPAGGCGPPVIDAAGNVYAVCDGYLMMFDSTLHQQWSVLVPQVQGQIINDSPIIGPGNVIYVSYDTESADGTNTDGGPPEMLMAFGP